MKLFLLTWLLAVSTTKATESSADCKCRPGDECWPSENLWAKFKDRVGGRLIAIEPLAAPCHDPNYDEEKCLAIKKRWFDIDTHIQSPSSIPAPLIADQSCDPFTEKEIPCIAGNHVSYAVNASNTEDVQATLKFAYDHNIRVVIRNTGLDYLGRSTAPDALAIWTHNLKRIEYFPNWTDELYEGKALEIGAGVQSLEALSAARDAGVVIVNADSPIVGMAGGYLQGGGYSGLSTAYGLSADNVLSFEVVTARGRIRTASRVENEDLYWALAGGGGGTFGIVTSVTLKAYPEAPVSGASFALTVPEDTDSEQIFDLIDVWHAELPRLVKAGLTISYSFSDSHLEAHAITAHNKTVSQLLAILRPVNMAMQKHGVRFNPTITSNPSYYEHYVKYWSPEEDRPVGFGTFSVGGRLISRDTLLTPEFDTMIRKIAEMGITFHGTALDVSKFGKHNLNSVLPQWRTAIIQSHYTLPWSPEIPHEEVVAAHGHATREVNAIIEAASPDAGAYWNEASIHDVDWKKMLYGPNYDQLLKTKKRFDPEDMVFVSGGVGSEEWKVRADGRLCRAAAEEQEQEEVKPIRDEL